MSAKPVRNRCGKRKRGPQRSSKRLPGVLNVAFFLIAYIVLAAGAPASYAWPAAKPNESATARPAASRIWRIQIQRGKLAIGVVATVTADPIKGTPLLIEVGPAEAIPPGSYIRIRGLPHDAVLSHGFVITNGLWAVPLNALSGLRIRFPAASPNDLRITVSLLTADGKLHAETDASIAVRSASLDASGQATNATTGSSGQASARTNNGAPAVLGFGPVTADREQALSLHAKGQEQLKRGNRSEERRVGKECRSRWSPYH